MRNSNLFKLLLSSALITCCVFPLAVNAREIRATAPERKSSSLLERIVSLFKSPENSLITRGEVCFVSPGNLGEQTVWSDRPSFIMYGTIPQAKIDLYSSPANYNYEQDGELIWTETISPNTTTLAYAGEQLQPGFVYDWVFSKADKTYEPITFKLMEQTEREAIATELTAIETQLQGENATAEALAIAKADYFINRQLWSDALQQLQSVENPSPSLSNKVADIKQYLCTKNNA
ncbi:hypothetical protein IQ255_10495 [Pleurocapsales cyanobacterium LEGE 10410]|nr:hypothetical protein [Pleurocapsales cyanobacterium LEGE 10410]